MTITKTIDTDQIKQSVDLREFAARYTELRKVSGGKEMFGPCPRPGCAARNNGFYVQADFFACRKCKPEGGDIFAFVMWLNGCDFKEAAAILTNAPMPTTQARRTVASKRHTEQPQDWQRNAEAIAKTAPARLFDDADQEAEQVRACLENVRKLEPHTWQAFGLGFTLAALPGTWDETKRVHVTPKQPAIVIPWYRGGKVCGVRYRFLQWHEYTDAEGKPRKEKQTALSGSSFSGVLYGGQALDVGAVSLSTLLICEGELNACSVWQAAHDTHLAVLSLGSESATISPATKEYAGRFATTIVWLDREERAQAVQAALPGSHPIQSPNGQDANDLLQAGKLGGFLAHQRFQAAKDRHEQERLLWDLWDAAQAWGGGDEDTSKMIRHIANTLGKTID